MKDLSEMFKRMEEIHREQEEYETEQRNIKFELRKKPWDKLTEDERMFLMGHPAYTAVIEKD